MSGGDDYVTIFGRLDGRRDAAVLLFNEEDERGHWIPRSTLFCSSDKVVDSTRLGDDVELKVRRWVAEREGFL